MQSHYRLQMVVFPVTVMSLWILTMLLHDAMVEWQAQFPQDTSNHFAQNITGEEIPVIEGFLAESQAL